MSGATKARRGTLAKWAGGLSEPEASEQLRLARYYLSIRSNGNRRSSDEASYLQARVSALRRRLRVIQQEQGGSIKPTGGLEQ